jgi:NTE family protein
VVREGRGELLSFLLFDEEFIAGLLRLGARDAGGCGATPRFWRGDATHDLSFARHDADAVNEQQAIAEFRARGMH